MTKKKKQTTPLAPPEGLSREALAEWNRVCAMLKAEGRLDKADVSVLNIYCRTYARYNQVTKLVDKHGPFTTHQNKTESASCHFKAETNLLWQLGNLRSQLGMTSSQRGAQPDANTGELEF